MVFFGSSSLVDSRDFHFFGRAFSKHGGDFSWIYGIGIMLDGLCKRINQWRDTHALNNIGRQTLTVMGTQYTEKSISRIGSSRSFSAVAEKFCHLGLRNFSKVCWMICERLGCDHLLGEDSRNQS